MTVTGGDRLQPRWRGLASAEADSGHQAAGQAAAVGEERGLVCEGNSVLFTRTLNVRLCVKNTCVAEMCEGQAEAESTNCLLAEGLLTPPALQLGSSASPRVGGPPPRWPPSHP